MDKLTSAPARWDAWNQTGGSRYPHEKVVQFCFRNYAPDRRPVVRALDLGCGGGVHTAFLAREGFLTSACDLSPVAVEHTRRRLAAESLSADLQIASMDEIEYPAEAFDVVICSGVLDSAGPSVARRALARLPQFLSHGAKGLFVFASDRDFRISSDNTLGLHGYTHEEVADVFSPFSSHLWIDRYVTTYENGTVQQFDWLVTIFQE
jgi:SAM-dependent methyltransferase